MIMWCGGKYAKAQDRKSWHSQDWMEPQEAGDQHFFPFKTSEKKHMMLWWFWWPGIAEIAVCGPVHNSASDNIAEK